jgi:hypothetical protein
MQNPLLPLVQEPIIAACMADLAWLVLFAVDPGEAKGRKHVGSMGGRVSLHQILTADMAKMRFNDLVALLGVLINHIKKGTALAMCRCVVCSIQCDKQVFVSLAPLSRCTLGARKNVHTLFFFSANALTLVLFLLDNRLAGSTGGFL